MTDSQATGQTIGSHIRQWRQRKHLSQIDCAFDAEISQRHLSFLESGRASPSRDLVLRLAERLDVPLRDRNAMLLAAGFAPVYPERSLDAPEMTPVRDAIDLILKGHEPYPALAVDRHWNLIASNAGLAPLLAGVALALLEPPVNVLRLSLHPEGLAQHAVNVAEWRKHLLERLRRQIAATGDTALSRLYRELSALPIPPGHDGPVRDYADLLVPLELVVSGTRLAFFSTVSVFGTPVDITLSEIVLECLFPADQATAEFMRKI